MVTIGTDAVATVTAHLDTEHVLSDDGEAAVLEVDASELPELSQHMHERYGRCGGFMLHESVAEAKADIPALKQVDYSITHGPVVKDVLAELHTGKLLGTIRDLSAMPNRYYRSEHGAKASRWLRDRWRSYTTRKDVTVELFDQGYPQQSVILTIPGTTRASEVVVIGGHLDSITMLGGKNGGTAPGADDDASGIATLSEVARALLAKDYRPARTVKFIAYAAEEVGLRGSQAVVRHMVKEQKINVVGALQLDMTNFRGSEKDIWLMKDFTSAPQNEFITKLIDTYVGATWGLDACGYACSDHASWYRVGVPASMPFEARMRDRNMKIHTKDDTLALSNNNADHAIKFARLGAAYAVEMAKGELGGPPATITAQHETKWWKLGVIALAVALFGRFLLRARR